MVLIVVIIGEAYAVLISETVALLGGTSDTCDEGTGSVCQTDSESRGVIGVPCERSLAIRERIDTCIAKLRIFIDIRKFEHEIIYFSELWNIY